jgi:transposase
MTAAIAMTTSCFLVVGSASSLLAVRPATRRQFKDSEGTTSSTRVRSRWSGVCRTPHFSAPTSAYVVNGRVADRSAVRAVHRGHELHVILDNSSTHTTSAVQAWLDAHPRVHFHFTPKGASWLNLVEAWFSILTRKSVRRGSFETVRALIRHIERYLAEWNTHPTPFVWTKDPAAIIKKALRRGPGR